MEIQYTNSLLSNLQYVFDAVMVRYEVNIKSFLGDVINPRFL